MGYNEDSIVDCLIVYPEKMIDNEHNEEDCDPDDCAQLDSLDDIENLLQRATPIKGYKRFYKLSFPMPHRV